MICIVCSKGLDWLSDLAARILVAAVGVCTPRSNRDRPGPVLFSESTSLLSAEGSWVPVDPKITRLFKVNSIDCQKQTSGCIEASAEYFAGHPHISVVYFQVNRRDNNGIIASNADAVCVTRTISIGFAAKHITDARESKALSAETQKARRSAAIPLNESWTFLLKNSKAWAVERDREHKE